MTILHPYGVVQHGTSRQLRYRVLGLLGRGGFGEAYEVERLDEDDEADLDSTCLKVTKDSAAWHGEAYFMGLLRSTKHVVQMLDAFPAFVGEGQAARMVFCIEMELLKGRTVEELCETRELPWTPDRVARQIRFILEPLAVCTV